MYLLPSINLACGFVPTATALHVFSRGSYKQLVSHLFPDRFAAHSRDFLAVFISLFVMRAPFDPDTFLMRFDEVRRRDDDLRRVRLLGLHLGVRLAL